MPYRKWSLRGVSPFPPGVWWLLIINSVMFLLELVFPRGLIYLLGLNPAAFWTHHQVWTPVTYMFLHGGFLHLFFNMLVLLMFGSRLEEFWGTRFFLKYYFITGIGAGVSNVLFTPNAPWTIIGASGAMFGLLAAYGLLFPNNIIFFYLIIPIKAKYLVILFGIFEFFASLRPGADPVAHLAHLGGMIIGVIYLLHYKIVRGMRNFFSNLVYSLKYQQEKRRRKAADELREEIDVLLDKISRFGYEKLTPAEKKRLKDASEQLRIKENSNRWR